MLRKGLITGVMAGLLSTGAAFAAHIRVTIAPPARVVETRPVAPGAGYVWTPGYQRWDGHAYVWSPGVWVKPPHRREHWVAQRWEHRRGGWEFHDGYWRR